MEAKNDELKKNGDLKFLSDFAIEKEANFFVTLTFNKNVSAEFAEKQLRHFDNKVSKYLFGKRHFKDSKKEKKDKEYCWRGVVESGENTGYRHFHLLVRICPESEFYSAKKVNHIKYVEAFQKYTPVIWKKLVPTGTSDVKLINTDNDRKKTANYMVKYSFKNAFEIYDCSMFR